MTVAEGAIGQWEGAASPFRLRYAEWSSACGKPQQSEATVRRFYLNGAMLALLWTSPALGQYATVIQACSHDIPDFCTPTPSGRGSLVECIKSHLQDFTDPCKAALVSITAVRKSCGADIQKHCPAIKPSAGRILLCVKKHFAALSEPCKEAIGRAAERRTAAH